MNLKELIRIKKGTDTYADLTARGGGTPSPKRWQQLMLDDLSNFPDPPTIKAIAMALGVTEMTVILACAESLDLEVHQPDSSFVTLLPPGTEKLAEKKTSLLLALVRDAVDEARAPK